MMLPSHGQELNIDSGAQMPNSFRSLSKEKIMSNATYYSQFGHSTYPHDEKLTSNFAPGKEFQTTGNAVNLSRQRLRNLFNENINRPTSPAPHSGGILDLDEALSAAAKIDVRPSLSPSEAEKAVSIQQSMESMRRACDSDQEELPKTIAQAKFIMDQMTAHNLELFNKLAHSGVPLRQLAKMRGFGVITADKIANAWGTDVRYRAANHFAPYKYLLSAADRKAICYLVEHWDSISLDNGKTVCLPDIIQFAAYI